MSLILGAAGVLTGCNSSGSPQTSNSGVGNTSTTPTASAASTLLVWDGAGVNPVDLGCLLATLSQENVPVKMMTDTDLAALSPAAVAGYLGLVFPDGSTSEALATLPAATQTSLQDAVNTYGLHMVAFGASSAIPGQLGLIPTSSSFWTDLLDIAEVVLDGLSLFFPQAAIISQFLTTGLPAIVQVASGSGQVSLFGPETSTPACGSDQATNPTGGTSIVNPLENLIQIIEGAVSSQAKLATVPVEIPVAARAA